MGEREGGKHTHTQRDREGRGYEYFRKNSLLSKRKLQSKRMIKLSISDTLVGIGSKLTDISMYVCACTWPYYI